MRTLHAGDRISIHTGKQYTEDATVETICHPDELPAIATAPNIGAVRAILAEGNYISVAMITYNFLGQPVAFIALQNTRGEWSDLKGQQLIIEPRTAENELLKKQQTRDEKPFLKWKRPVDWSKF